MRGSRAAATRATATEAPAAAQRAGERVVGRAQPGGAAERDEEDVGARSSAAVPFCLAAAMVGTLINVGTVLAGTAIGTPSARGCPSASSSACWPGWA